MMFFRDLGWVDPWRLQAWAWQHKRDLPDRLIDGDWQHEELEKWASLRLTIGQARRLAEQGGWELKGARLDRLLPNEHQPWTKTDLPHVVVHVGIVSNPNAVLFVGTELVCLAPGRVVAFGSNLLHSASNMGASERIHLVLSLALTVAGNA